jgi:hypothetical protein
MAGMWSSGAALTQTTVPSSPRLLVKLMLAPGLGCPDTPSCCAAPCDHLTCM